MRVYWPRRQAHFCLPRIGQDTGELVLKGPLVEAFYPRQTLTAEKVSTVDTGYTTVGSALISLPKMTSFYHFSDGSVRDRVIFGNLSQ